MISGFRTDLAELRQLRSKLTENDEQLADALKRMKDTGPKNLGRRSLDSACEDFEDDWSYGLQKTQERVKTLKEGLDKIIKGYEKTEQSIDHTMDGLAKPL